MIVRTLSWLFVLAAVWCCLSSPVPVRMGTNANETFQRVADKLDAQHAESAITGLHGSLGLSDMVEQVHDGKIEGEKIRVVAAILRNTNELNIHRMRGGSNNRVFVSPDGHQEAVYDVNGELVKDGINDGSYNYFDPQKDALRHFSIDIAPWLLFGQSRNDATTRDERVHEYAADVFDGVKRALKAPRTGGKLDDVKLEEPGCAEAVAVFLLALEHGKADELIHAVSLQEKKNDRELVQLVRKFEAGLQKLMAEQ